MVVVQLHLVVLHAAFIVQHGAFVLAHQRLLVADRLVADGMFLHCSLIARQVGASLRQQRAVTRQRALCLLQLRLRRTRVHLNQRLPLAHHLPFAIIHCQHLAANLAVDIHRLQRRNRAQRIQIKVHGARLRLGNAHSRIVAEHAWPRTPPGHRAIACFVQKWQQKRYTHQQHHQPGKPMSLLVRRGICLRRCRRTFIHHIFLLFLECFPASIRIDGKFRTWDAWRPKLPEGRAVNELVCPKGNWQTRALRIYI